MKRQTIASMSKRILLPLTLVSATLATPAFANYFHTPGSDAHLFVGGSPSPNREELRGSRYYPVESLMQNEQGKVALKVFLTEEGTMKDAVVESSSGSARLDQAAVRYIKENYDYDPAPGAQMPEFVRTVVNFKVK